MITFGETIKAEREALRLSLHDMAERLLQKDRLTVSVSYISNIEKALYELL